LHTDVAPVNVDTTEQLLLLLLLLLPLTPPAEARLLEIERRSMHARVSDQLESERRAALAAGRRRVEQEVGQVLAGEQATLLAQQQVRQQERPAICSAD
jgi:hypothetical protein